MKKANQTSKSDFSRIYERVRELEKKNRELSADNRALAKKLDAKRYKAIDFVIDSAYSIARGSNGRKSLIKKNLNAKSDAELEPGSDLSAKTMRLIEEEFKRNPIKGQVDIININFYDWDGEVLYRGGAERYVFDLACLLKKQGLKPRILQCSNKPFEKTYRGIKIVGVGAGSRSDMRENSFIYTRFCREAELIIASPLELACEIRGASVIGINHGINFDGDWNSYSKGYTPDYSVYIDALKNVVSCVCVDTNFINWTRTVDYKSSLKEVYVPNYYDEELFKPCKKKQSDVMTFVFPRRIYNARGADITIEAFDILLEKYKNKIKINFVGQIDNEEIGKKLEALMDKYEGLVAHYEYDMKDMHKAYEVADVVLVPTRYCEGTSLSCIEGMVSGAAIITTTVGGLPNLVIDGYNGYLISPTADDLIKAASSLIEDPKKAKQMAENGKKVAQEAFNKSSWDRKWNDVVSSALK